MPDDAKLLSDGTDSHLEVEAELQGRWEKAPGSRSRLIYKEPCGSDVCGGVGWLPESFAGALAVVIFRWKSSLKPK